MRLLTQDEEVPEENKDFYNKLVDKILEQVPEDFDPKDVKKYLNEEKLSKSVEELVKETYGEEALKGFNQNNNFDDESMNQEEQDLTKNTDL
jgi:hypothetical protein